ncbi:MAG: hypothetical protein AAGA80_00880 [Cyanobacteria bacterium P01_F01_bin.143]
MPKPTQAHLDRTVSKNQPLEERKKVLSQMSYYMGAKLLEVGVNPQAVTYRWSVEDKQTEQVCILSAFWGNSRKTLLSGKEPITGAELIHCARGNGYTGVENTAKLCGYASNIKDFQAALKQACEEAGLDITAVKSLSSLI